MAKIYTVGDKSKQKREETPSTAKQKEIFLYDFNTHFYTETQKKQT